MLDFDPTILSNTIHGGMDDLRRKIGRVISVAMPHKMTICATAASHRMGALKVIRTCERLPERAYVCEMGFLDYGCDGRPEKMWVQALGYIGYSARPIMEALEMFKDLVITNEIEVQKQLVLEDRLKQTCKLCRMPKASTITGAEAKTYNARGFCISADLGITVFLYSPIYVGAVWQSGSFVSKANTTVHRSFCADNFDEKLKEIIKCS